MTTNIKVAYKDVIAFLEANQNKKVKTILDELKELCSSKGSSIGSTFLKDDDGNTTAIYCYYFKQWMPLSDVEFGLKASTASGFNTMCKEGVSFWTKQQRVAKKSSEELLDKLSNGELLASDLPEAREAIEVERKLIQESKVNIDYMFSTDSEVLKWLDTCIKGPIDKEQAES